jgi:hypothetical protein
MKYPRVTYAVALGVLIAYGFFTWWMVHSFTVATEDWTRLTVIYGGVSGIVLAAAGVVLGTAVQQPRVKSAEDDANQAKTEASRLRTDAAVGRSVEGALAAIPPTSVAPSIPSESAARIATSTGAVAARGH